MANRCPHRIGAGMHLGQPVMPILKRRDGLSNMMGSFFPSTPIFLHDGHVPQQRYNIRPYQEATLIHCISSLVIAYGDDWMV